MNSEKCYLYSIWNGTLREYCGEVSQSTVNSTPLFNALNQYGRKIKTLLCSPNEGEIYNTTVWFHKPDKISAARILIEYEESKIAELENKIDNHKIVIQMLKREMEKS